MSRVACIPLGSDFLFFFCLPEVCVTADVVGPTDGFGDEGDRSLVTSLSVFSKPFLAVSATSVSSGSRFCTDTTPSHGPASCEGPAP